MKILTDFTIIDRKVWTAYVEQHPNGMVFHLPEMVDLYAEADKVQPLVVCAQSDEGVILGLLIALVQWDFKGALRLLTKRSIIMGGPIVTDNDSVVAEAIMAAYESEVRSYGAIFSQYRNLTDMQWMDCIFRKKGYTYKEHLDIQHDLTVERETIISGVDKNKRGNVRKSTNKGTTFEEIETHEDYLKCLELVYGTYNRVGLPCPSTGYFEAAWKHLMPTGRMKTFVARLEGEIIGTRLELVCGQNIYDWWAGSDDAQKNKYPNDFIPYNILLWGHDNGYALFDFGGAGHPNKPYGVREHKLKFGGTLVNFGRYEKTHKPLLMLIGRMGFPIYKAMKKLIMRSK